MVVFYLHMCKKSSTFAVVFKQAYNRVRKRTESQKLYIHGAKRKIYLLSSMWRLPV